MNSMVILFFKFYYICFMQRLNQIIMFMYIFETKYLKQSFFINIGYIIDIYIKNSLISNSKIRQENQTILFYLFIFYQIIFIRMENQMFKLVLVVIESGCKRFCFIAHSKRGNRNSRDHLIVKITSDLLGRRKIKMKTWD